VAVIGYTTRRSS